MRRLRLRVPPLGWGEHRDEEAHAVAPIGFADKVAFVWKVADKLRGTFKQHEYGSVMLPLLVLRRMDAVLAPTKQAVLDAAKGMGTIGEGQTALLKKASGHRFYNTSPLTFATLLGDDKALAENLRAYIRKLSPEAYAVMEAYDFDPRIDRLDRAGILYAVVADFADLDLRPSVVSNEAMGYIFEELLRKFSEMSNETAGEHYTPREVISLMVNLLVSGSNAQELTDNPKPVRTVYDPAAGTGGMLMTALHHIKELNPAAIVNVFGQELNDETWAIAQSDLMMQGADPDRMRSGNSLTGDAFPTQKFDYILANPPYGVDWKAYAAPIRDEHTKQGFNGRFGGRSAAGLRRVAAVPAAHALAHEAGRVARGDRAVRFAVVLRAGRVGGVADPPLDPGERLARGHRRPAGPDVLQHGHLHVRVDPDQRQGRR